MNPITVRELLTAAIDGELSAAERKAAQRLLRQSASARALFSQLKADAVRLKKLPHVPAPAVLAEEVMNAIQERGMTPTPLPPGRHVSKSPNWIMLPVWTNLATAAAILIVIGFGSYMYFSASNDYYAKLDRDRRQASKLASLPTESNGPGKPRAVEKGPEPKEIDPGSGALVRQSPGKFLQVGPAPRVVHSDIITGNPIDMPPEIEPFDLNKIRVSQLFDMHELSKDEQVRKKLATVMKKDELIRLDLFCQSTPKAMQLISAALKARGINAITDAFVRTRLSRKVATELMIFTEALTADDVAQLLASLGAGDAKGGAGEFETVVAAPFLPADLSRLGRLLGVPNVLPKPANGKQGVDIRKPLPEGTANHVAATLTKMGTGSVTPPKPEKVAVVVAYSPMNPRPAASKEIKQFLDRRGQRQAHAKPLMLVLRTTK